MLRCGRRELADGPEICTLVSCLREWAVSHLFKKFVDKVPFHTSKIGAK
jgi:hypothetical protein